MTAMQWIENHYPIIHAHARAQYARFADDLVQETCIRLLRYDELTLSLAYKIMRNHWIDRIRAKDTQVLSLDAPIDDGEDAEELGHAIAAEDPPCALERQREQQALRQKFYRVMKQLTSDHRQVLELVVLGYRRHPGTTTRREVLAAGSYDAAASIMGCPRGTTASRLLRAKAAFRSAWERKPGRAFASDRNRCHR